VRRYAILTRISESIQRSAKILAGPPAAGARIPVLGHTGVLGAERPGSRALVPVGFQLVPEIPESATPNAVLSGGASGFATLLFAVALFESTSHAPAPGSAGRPDISRTAANLPAGRTETRFNSLRTAINDFAAAA
jgi:hypothetical protein